MSSEKRDFDKVAGNWDEDPAKVRLANGIADTIISQITLTSNMNVLDFGCGTGLLSLRLQPFVHSVTGVDSSRGMLDVINSKIENHGLTNVSAKLLDLENGDSLQGDYQLVTSAMTLHHVCEVEPLIERFYQMLLPNGCLCVADLDLDQGRFHGDNTGVFHHGFDRGALQSIFEKAGFVNVRALTATNISRPNVDGELSTFTVFLMIGEKRNV
jgi:2-polyprenyl-3-methyl-5-hydroxy-6-metoxy-1,4-benzoquinol methylase